MSAGSNLVIGYLTQFPNRPGIDNSWTRRDGHLQKVIRLQLRYHKKVSSGHAERFLTERAIGATNWRENTWGQLNRTIWLVYWTDRNTRGFWLAKRTFGWKNFMPENFLEINRYFTLTSYCNTIGQSNNTFSLSGFLCRENEESIFWSFGRQNK